MSGPGKFLGLVTGALLTAGGFAWAEGERPPRPGPERLGPRELPQGASEAEIRRHCTAKYDEEAANFADPTASGWGGISDAQLLQEFRRCMLRHGVRP